MINWKDNIQITYPLIPMEIIDRQVCIGKCIFAGERTVLSANVHISRIVNLVNGYQHSFWLYLSKIITAHQTRDLSSNSAAVSFTQSTLVNSLSLYVLSYAYLRMGVAEGHVFLHVCQLHALVSRSALPLDMRWEASRSILHTGQSVDKLVEASRRNCY